MHIGERGYFCGERNMESNHEGTIFQIPLKGEVVENPLQVVRSTISAE